MKRIINCLLFVFCILCPLSAEGLRVLFIGDSITDGNWGNSDGGAMPSSERNLWDMNHIYGSGYMYLCASYYQSKYPERDYHFFNRGISGNTLADLKQRWEEDVIALQPDVLSLLIGINDVNHHLNEKMAEPFDTLAWERDYRALLDRSLKMNPSLKIVLGAPFVVQTGRMKAADDFDVRNRLVHCLSRIVQRIATDYHAIFLPYDKMFENLLLEPPALQDTYWIWDGIHPTPAGHKRMSELWIEEFDKWGSYSKRT